MSEASKSSANEDGPPEKRVAWTHKQVDVATEDDFKAVLSEIKPLLVTAQTINVNATGGSRAIYLNWSAHEDFQLNDESERQYLMRFKGPFQKQNSLELFRVLAENATKLSRLEISDTWKRADGINYDSERLPPLREILLCLGRVGLWQDRLLHLRLGRFRIEQTTFGGLKTYPEALRSLHLGSCTPGEDNGIDNFLSRIGHHLEVLDLSTPQTRPDEPMWPLFLLMRTAIRGMTRLKKLTLYGSVDHRDEAGMENFVQSVVGLTNLKSLIVYAYGTVVDEGNESLQDKLVKGVCRTGISYFGYLLVTHTLRSNPPVPPLRAETIDELANYISNRGQCKLTHLSLHYGIPVPTSAHRQDAEALLSLTAIETGLLNAIGKGLSVPKFTLPIVDTDETRRVQSRITTDNGRLIRRPTSLRNFADIKRQFVAAKLDFVLNQFYLPIVAALNLDERGLVLPGLWPHILAKGKKKKYDETCLCGGFKLDSNVRHPSYLFAILRERPCLVSLYRS